MHSFLVAVREQRFYLPNQTRPALGEITLGDLVQGKHVELENAHLLLVLSSRQNVFLENVAVSLANLDELYIRLGGCVGGELPEALDGVCKADSGSHSQLVGSLLWRS